MVIICKKVSLVRTYLSLPEVELLLCLSGLVLTEDPMGLLHRPLCSHIAYFQERCPKISTCVSLPEFDLHLLISVRPTEFLCIRSLYLYFGNWQKASISVELTRVFPLLLEIPVLHFLFSYV